MFSKLEQLVLEWAEGKGILEGSDPLTQFSKTDEEITELYEALMAGDTEATKDELGDVVVTLIILAKMGGFTLAEALQTSYQKISKRKGAMKDGMFVKEANV